MEPDFFLVMANALSFLFTLINELLSLGMLAGLCWYVYTHRIVKQPVNFIVYGIVTVLVFSIMREIYCRIVYDGMGYWTSFIILLALSFMMTKPVLHGLRMGWLKVKWW